MKSNFLQDIRERRFREGVWQFMIDHSHITQDGKYKIIITTEGSGNFWKRVEARIRGDFKRYELEERNNENERLTYLISKKKSDVFGKLCSEIDRGGNYYKKLVLFLYRKTRDIIQNENHD